MYVWFYFERIAAAQSDKQCRVAPPRLALQIVTLLHTRPQRSIAFVCVNAT